MAHAPSLGLWAGELLDIPGLLCSPLMPPVRLGPGHGRPVIVFPGYLTGDISSLRLRRSLNAAGYRARGWELGQNKGARADLLDRLTAKLARVRADEGSKVALVGWSLGGIYARELAKLVPDDVAMVVTLGSPFSGSARANNAWRLYEWFNDHPVDNPPIAIDRPVKPPVPTYAVWSPRDGIVAPASARGEPGEADGSYEVRCRHLSLARSREGIEQVGRLLTDKWPAA